MTKLNTILGQDIWGLTYNETVTLTTICACGHTHTEVVDVVEFMLADNALKEYKYTIDNDDVQLTIDTTICNNCARKNYYAYELDRPTGFDNITMYHGLAAFGKDIDIDMLMNRVHRLYTEDNIDICCTTEGYIGPFGIAVEGTVLAASNTDIFSYRDGDRIKIDSKYIQYLVKDIKNIVHLGVGYNEIIVTDVKIKSFWIKDKQYEELVKELANKYNVEMTYVH